MVSLDSPEKNAAFAKSLDGNFPVVSDPGGKAARAYGALGLAGLYTKRWTFYIDSEGVVRKIDRSVKPGTAGQDVARTLGELGFPKR